jgi:hypothetical protein
LLHVESVGQNAHDQTADQDGDPDHDESLSALLFAARYLLPRKWNFFLHLSLGHEFLRLISEQTTGCGKAVLARRETGTLEAKPDIAGTGSPPLLPQRGLIRKGHRTGKSYALWLKSPQLAATSVFDGIR